MIVRTDRDRWNVYFRVSLGSIHVFQISETCIVLTKSLALASIAWDVGHLGTTGYPRAGIKLKLADVPELNVRQTANLVISGILKSPNRHFAVHCQRQAFPSRRVSSTDPSISPFPS